MVVKYLKVKVQGLKYYVTEECNILVGVWALTDFVGQVRLGQGKVCNKKVSGFLIRIFQKSGKPSF